MTEAEGKIDWMRFSRFATKGKERKAKVSPHLLLHRKCFLFHPIPHCLFLEHFFCNRCLIPHETLDFIFFRRKHEKADDFREDYPTSVQTYSRDLQTKVFACVSAFFDWLVFDWCQDRLLHEMSQSFFLPFHSEIEFYPLYFSRNFPDEELSVCGIGKAAMVRFSFHDLPRTYILFFADTKAMKEPLSKF